jgi:hypothetical protein
MAALLSACSQAGYPAVLDSPMPRGDPEMSPDQVQQATDALISDRNQLSAQTAADSQANPPPSGAGNGTAAPATTGSTKTAGAGAKP